MTDLQRLFFKMLFIRKAEEAISKKYPEKQMRCPVHLSIGQEASAVGVCETLTKEDLMVSTHRGHAHYLAKGGSLKGLIGELYGKATGCSRGFGGSMHLVDKASGFAGSTSIVGGTIPIGVGLAFAKRLRGELGCVAIGIGDAAIEQGVFHESANFASLHKLRVIFVCENNLYSCYTHIRDRQPHRQSMWAVAKAHGMDYESCDGNNVEFVRDAATIHHFKRPVFLELFTYRHLEHCGPNNDDHLNYRAESEREFWASQDPIGLTINKLTTRGEWTLEFQSRLKTIDTDIELAFIDANHAPFADESEIGRVYAPN